MEFHLYEINSVLFVFTLELILVYKAIIINTQTNHVMRKYFVILSLIFLTHSTILGQNTYNIGILLDESSPEIDSLLTLLQTEIKAVVGVDAIINFDRNNILTNDFKLQKAQDNYNTLMTNNTDIILSLGIINSIVVANQTIHQKPTIVFGPITSESLNIDSTRTTSGIENLTYLIAPSSFRADLIRLKDLSNFQSLGIVIEESDFDALPVEEVFDNILSDFDASYRLIPFQTLEDITNNLEGIDAVYMAGGFFLSDEEIQELAQVFIEKKLPSFTNTNIEDVENGLMATNRASSNLTQFFRRIALTVEAYINGAALSELPMYIESEQLLTLNFNTADLVGVPLRYSLVTQMNFVGDVKNFRAEETYNLIEVFDTVLDRNLGLQSAEKNIELNEQDIQLAKSNYLPSITGSATASYLDPTVANNLNPEFQATGAITAEQLIFSQSANANISIQKTLLKAQQESYNAAELDALLNASNIYFNVLASKVNVQIQEQNLQLTKENLRIATQNFETGLSNKLDVLRFESQLAQNTQTLIQAINQLSQDFIALNQILNNPVGVEIDIADARLGEGIFENYDYQTLFELLDSPEQQEPFIAFLIEEGKNNSPDLKSLVHNIEATERTIQLNGRDRFYPTVAFQAQYNATFLQEGQGSTIDPALSGFLALPQAPFANYNLGLNVSIPIFNQNQNNIQKQTAIIQKDQLDIEKQNLELAIATNISQTVLELVNQIANIELSRVSEEYARESLELTQSSYSNGAVNIIQLIDAQNNYFQAQLARANAEYFYLLTVLQIERFMSYSFLLHTDEENDAFRNRFAEFLINYND